MRLSILNIAALGAGFTSVTANPIVARQEAAALTTLTTLFATTQVYTGALNATLLTGLLDPSAALSSAGTELTGLTSAVNDATTSIKSLTAVSKRSDMVESRQLGLVALVAAIDLILFEVFGTISALIAGLGLSGLLSFLNPLTGSLGLLILAIEVLVDFLLLDVTLLLDTLLTGLALALGGLVL